MDNTKLHKTAIIASGAKLGKDVEVGPYSVIGPESVIGDGTKISSHVVIDGRTTIGKECQLFPGAVVGTVPQDKHHNHEDQVTLEIGDGNIIRECVTINPGTVKGGGETVVGNNNLFMAYSHVAHDCVIGNNCVLANSGTLAGHVTLEDNAVIGGLSAVHQFVRLGRLSIVGGCTKVVQDIPPFSTCDGHPARVYGLNLIGLRRAQISRDTVKALKLAFKILFFSGLSKTNAIERVEAEVPMGPEMEHLIFFLKTTKRGLCS